MVNFIKCSLISVDMATDNKSKPFRGLPSIRREVSPEYDGPYRDFLVERYKELEEVKEDFLNMRRRACRDEISSEEVRKTGGELWVKIGELDDQVSSELNLSDVSYGDPEWPSMFELLSFHKSTSFLRAYLFWCFLGSNEMDYYIRQAKE